METQAVTDKVPRLSIVIPTFRRPEFLPRAVASALACAQAGEVEVIVVPNGADCSWQRSLAPLQGNPALRIAPIARANANSARNQGLALARGTYIRFLDDDDSLDATGVTAQLHKIESSRAEICSGAIRVIDDHGQVLGIMRQADQHDLFIAMVRPGRVCLPTAHVFRRIALGDLRWNEQLDVEQDTDWMFRIASTRQWNWVVLDDVVGEWTQHPGLRTSGTITHYRRSRLACATIFQAVNRLRSTDNFDQRRAHGVAEALWEFAHTNFHLAPMYWTRIIRIARTYDSDAGPMDPFFCGRLARHIDPLLIEWAMIPKRRLNDLWRLLRL